MHPQIPTTVDSAAVAYEKVAAEAGCSLHRDAVDRRLIAELRSLGRQGKTIPHTDARGEALVGGLGEIAPGLAAPDSDHDGIPDAWESSHGLNPRDGADAGQLAPNGRANIENYLDDLVRRGRSTEQ
jgi:hypothetical protein